MRLQHTPEHQGFKKVTKKIARNERISEKRASKILAASTRKNSKQAKTKIRVLGG